mmetsp:Transcript_28063/g.56364  ORF Transcript_28063/g.56364 Transcript_28063/m.56364 type:complete len:239 (-) Transcript_28063:1125-1841(-)
MEGLVQLHRPNWCCGVTPSSPAAGGNSAQDSHHRDQPQLPSWVVQPMVVVDEIPILPHPMTQHPLHQGVEREMAHDYQIVIRQQHQQAHLASASSPPLPSSLLVHHHNTLEYPVHSQFDSYLTMSWHHYQHYFDYYHHHPSYPTNHPTSPQNTHSSTPPSSHSPPPSSQSTHTIPSTFQNHVATPPSFYTPQYHSDASYAIDASPVHVVGIPCVDWYRSRRLRGDIDGGEVSLIWNVW